MRFKRLIRRVAALYDIHGNAPAFDAVLREIQRYGVVIGRDVAWGPEPALVLERWMSLNTPAYFVRGGFRAPRRNGRPA